MNNCVGHANYAHFLRFLFMVDVACSYHLWMITKRAFGAMAFASHPSTLQVIMLILNYTACVPVLMAVGMFSLYHFWCVAVNTTTIEGWEKDKVSVLRRKGKILEVRRCRSTLSSPASKANRRLTHSSATPTTSATSPTCAPSSVATPCGGVGLHEGSLEMDCITL